MHGNLTAPLAVPGIHHKRKVRASRGFRSLRLKFVPPASRARKKSVRISSRTIGGESKSVIIYLPNANKYGPICEVK